MRAQESRRILDRLYGYTLSPVLWKKVQTGLSAGRVQSVAVRLIVDREEERLAFTRGDLLGSRGAALGRGARVHRDARAPRRRARRDRQGLRRERRADRQERARAVGGRRPRARRTRSGQHLPWTVTAVDEKPGVERPAPPFTTSTLTQEASRKLGFSTERTMQAAQRLFQDGHISYHRTDSTTLSEKALAESAAAIREMFGDRVLRRARAATRRK